MVACFILLRRHLSQDSDLLSHKLNLEIVPVAGGLVPPLTPPPSKLPASESLEPVSLVEEEMVGRQKQMANQVTLT